MDGDVGLGGSFALNSRLHDAAPPRAALPPDFTPIDMISSLRLAVSAMAVCLLLAGCGQKGPLFLPKDEHPPAPEKAKVKPKAKPKPQQSPGPEATPEPEMPAPDDDPQDAYSPMSDQPGF